MALVLESFVANPELSSLEKCKKAVLFDIASFYSIPVARSLRKDDLRAAVICGLRDQGVLSVDRTSAVEVDAVAVTPDDDDDEDRSAALSGSGPSARSEAEVTARADVTPPVQVSKPEGKHPLNLPRFDPISPESSPGSKLDARLKLHLARFRLEQEEKREESEFQLRRELELELKKLDIEKGALKVRQLELQNSTASLASSAQNVSVSPASSLMP